MFELQRRYRALARDRGMRMPSGYDLLAPIAERAEAAMTAYPEALVPCHNDLLAANFLDDGHEVRIIDYEYSGMNEPAFELGNLAQESGLSDGELAELVIAYYGAPDDRLLARARTWRAISGYGWTLWGSSSTPLAGSMPTSGVGGRQVRDGRNTDDRFRLRRNARRGRSTTVPRTFEVLT